jgi:hypothetical protein
MSLVISSGGWTDAYVLPSGDDSLKILEIPGSAVILVDWDPPFFPLNPDLPRKLRTLPYGYAIYVADVVLKRK